MALLAAILAYAGLAGLALAMDRHHRQVWRRGASPPRRMALRLAGAASLGGSLAASAVPAGWGVGIVLWLGLLTAAALGVAMLLAYVGNRRTGRLAEEIPAPNGISPRQADLA